MKNLRYIELRYNGKTYTQKYEIDEILLKNNMNWFLDAEIENVRIEIMKDTLILNGGIWYNGIWEYGVIRDIEWKSGTFQNGVIYNGMFKRIKVEKGIIFDGTFIKGDILFADIRGGEFKDVNISNNVNITEVNEEPKNDIKIQPEDTKTHSIQKEPIIQGKVPKEQEGQEIQSQVQEKIILKNNTKLKTLKSFKSFLNETIKTNNNKEFIVYHSTDSKIDEFDFNKIELKPNSSTRIDGIFFSNIPQTSWGENIYKVKIISQNPAIFDLSKSKFDSLGIQEAFDALLRGETSYIIDDLVEYGDLKQEDAENLVEQWINLDLIVIKNEVYGKHDIEYIVPELYYNGKNAEIIIMSKI
jgi:hypothetical protein